MLTWCRQTWRRWRGIRTDQDVTGRAGERAAARMLRRAGYRVIARNVQVEFGELDLLCIAPDAVTIVAVEVKAKRVAESPRSATTHHPVTPDEFDLPRTDPASWPAEAKANHEKRKKVLRIVRHLARANGWTERPLRVDVVGVDLPPRGKAVVRHHINVRV